jgi:hypothetical protein
MGIAELIKGYQVIRRNQFSNVWLTLGLPAKTWRADLGNGKIEIVC